MDNSFKEASLHYRNMNKFLFSRIYFGRTHIKTVAEARKIELEKFLLQLLNLAPEISEVWLCFLFDMKTFE